MSNMYLESFFENSARHYPDHTAIEQGNVKYSYSEADREANRLANYLVSHGLAPEKKAVILLPRSAEVIITMIGVLKSGAAYKIGRASCRERVFRAV